MKNNTNINIKKNKSIELSNIRKIEVICRTLSDSNRLRIIEMLSDGEKCGCKLLEEFNITQPTLSHHMKLLCECGLVNDRKEGKWHHYSLNKEIVIDFMEHIKKIGRIE